MEIYRAYKFRLYPTNEQKKLINKTLGCKRFVYNYYLNYLKDNNSINRFDLHKDLPKLKEENAFLKEVDSTVLCSAVDDLCKAFNDYYAKRKGYPKFKNRFSKQSYRTSCIRSIHKEKEYSNIEVDLLIRNIKLPKLGKVKIRGFRTKNKIEGKILNATISRESTGKYYVSVVVVKDALIEKVTPTSIVGIDLGIKDLVVTSDGIKYSNEKVLMKYERRLKRLQRKLSRQVKGSKNYLKTKEKIAKIYAKIKNYRKHYLNDIANEIVNDHDIIVTENLLVKDMFKDKKKAFNKSLSDACVSTLRSLIEWKCKIKGKIYYKINTYYPSSQICSHCGYKNSKLKNLSIREYDCPKCGSHNDRDINASLNISLEGLKLHYNLVSIV
ncbi:MAG TPA: transposase [Candidatus Onthousia excrementipullorum]|uniref:Transposase n=1 Tax=Candidatus Onthousia excrementipullorum TaxID=2840884 RepID=A0A9D1DV64_9FIRM|nr:transposase [Candidatus Onthousia excrementipullorum]